MQPSILCGYRHLWNSVLHRHNLRFSIISFLNIVDYIVLFPLYILMYDIHRNTYIYISFVTLLLFSGPVFLGSNQGWLNMLSALFFAIQSFCKQKKDKIVPIHKIFAALSSLSFFFYEINEKLILDILIACS